MNYFLRRGLWSLLSICLLMLMLFAIVFLYLESQLPDVETLKEVKLQVPLRIYTSDKRLIATYGEKRRLPVDYNDVPKDLVYAILSTEDQRFFEHPGVDVFGLGRAAFQLIRTGRKSQGGSTITMQVARNFFLSRKKTFLRKFNEILLAIKIDKELSKEKILELYLNKIYLGNRAYGVGAAARVYYGKSLKELSLAQLAMIAGLPQAPSSQNPLANPKAALKRRNHVLLRMLEEGHISQEQYDEAVQAPLTAQYHGRRATVSAPYVAEMIRQALYEHFGGEAYTKGYKVYTTIDSKLQKASNTALETALLDYDSRHGYRGPVEHLADISQISDAELSKQLKKHPSFNQQLIPALVTRIENKSIHCVLADHENITIEWQGIKWARKAFKKGLGTWPSSATEVVKVGDIVYVSPSAKGHWRLAQLPTVEGAFIALSPKDGAIYALTGGFNFYKSKFNRVTQAERQPGSSFKPFIYSAALAKGYTLASLINDAPVVVDDPSQEDLWRPQNDNHRFNGPTRLRQGLVRSRNLVSIRLLKGMGIDYAIKYLQRFGFSAEKLPKSLSLALGSLTISPLELATAYAVIANGGFKIEPYLIQQITDSSNHIILKAKPRIACSHCYQPNSESTLSSDQQAPRVISEQVAYLMTQALQDVIQNGTGRGAKVLKRSDISGKTGTTNDQQDAWFAGFNSEIVSTAWVGFDNPQSLHEYGARVALPMWVDFMRVALANTPEVSMKAPTGIVSVRIDPKTGLRATASQKNSIFESFRKEFLPQEYSTIKPQSANKVSNNVANDYLF